MKDVGFIFQLTDEEKKFCDDYFCSYREVYFQFSTKEQMKTFIEELSKYEDCEEIIKLIHKGFEQLDTNLPDFTMNIEEFKEIIDNLGLSEEKCVLKEKKNDMFRFNYITIPKNKVIGREIYNASFIEKKNFVYFDFTYPFCIHDFSCILNEKLGIVLENTARKHPDLPFIVHAHHTDGDHYNETENCIYENGVVKVDREADDCYYVSPAEIVLPYAKELGIDEDRYALNKEYANIEDDKKKQENVEYCLNKRHFRLEKNDTEDGIKYLLIPVSYEIKI